MKTRHRRRLGRHGAQLLLVLAGLTYGVSALASTLTSAGENPHSLQANHPNASSNTNTRKSAITTKPPIVRNSNFWTRDHLTGDWGGERTRLDKAGVVLHGFYVGEFAHTIDGGESGGGGSAWAQQLGIGADFNLQDLVGWTGALFHLGMNFRFGNSLSAERIGNRLEVQEVYGAGETIRPTEISLEQRFDDNRVNALVGFYPMGNEFASTPLLCVFQNVGFCAHPQNLPASSGWSDYPTGKWGGRLKITPTDNTYAEVGIFDVNPTYYNKDNGFRLDFNGSTGQIFPVEFGITTAFGAAKLPGHYKIGGYYDTTNAKNVITGIKESGRYGGYILADQMLFSFNGTPNRGLIGFAQASISDDDTSTFANQLDAGLIAQGPFAARPNDFIALGWVRAGINDRITEARRDADFDGSQNLSSGENVFELGYGLKLTPAVLLHPNIQYVDNPGTFADEKFENAWVFGFQTKIIL